MGGVRTRGGLRLADIDFNNLVKEELIRVFTEAGGVRITEQELDQAIEDGMPLNEDGTLNALHVIAWLVGEKYGEI